MKPLRFILGLVAPRHKALAAQCTTGSGLDVTLEELNRRLGVTPEEAEALDGDIVERFGAFLSTDEGRKARLAELREREAAEK